MKITCDLHCHSGYAGGTGNISLEHLASSMVLKGIDVLGTGDCLFPKWKDELADKLEEQEEGLFSLKKPEVAHYDLSVNQLKSARFILQTELIFTFSEQGSKKRKRMDVVFLFRSFANIDAAIRLLERWKVKNTIGRPFVLCKNGKEVGEKIRKILAIDNWIEAFPAHVMTPQGVFGSTNHVNSLNIIFGDNWQDIHAIETGLSASPETLEMIPELDNFTFLSNSDLHSAGLDKVGREFTCLEVDRITYKNIIQSIRTNKVAYTFEFMPEEGRYFLTGHKGSRPKHKGEICVYSPDQTPRSKRCPICGKDLYIGVLERAHDLREKQSPKVQSRDNKIKRKFFTVVPLFEIIQYLGHGRKTSLIIYKNAIEPFGNEKNLWLSDPKDINDKLEGVLKREVIDAVIHIKKGNFYFDPPGYDGVKGKLVIGKKRDFGGFKIEPKNTKVSHQLTFQQFS